ncbi:universal stress protein [Ligilactobacillus apodemi DSM 16634 = JCM 16172]|uniref:Universal stress protein n=2 Tax=Ligilactobacillus TaxID=2767887 RepID=A0A0R1TSD8_9LACO|nr:universal stress protein [Ligilactobacillus apodemi]KRL84284.1 universal stress protein [Ligilactobacillus apodemi DSM 16634 = JCM 16172]MCR1901328.1 universal stress protein [Ligilactobacillus apodemi]
MTMIEQEYRNILVPVDGSKAAEIALERATEIALRNKAHLDILNVIDLKQFSVSFAGMIDANGDVVYQTFEDVDGYVAKLVKRVKKQGLADVSAHVRFGSPRSVIAREFPADHKNDLIVMGPTGLNPVERLLVGSVTDYVTRAAASDVIIAR